MATQETNLRDQEIRTTARREATGEKLSLVVDRPSSPGLALLILPFATPPGEEALGRRIALLVQRRLGPVRSLVVGHGLLVATGPDGRRYVPLYHPLSDEQAYSCGLSWRAGAVLSGSITLKPSLRWALTLRDVAGRFILFEDTLIGNVEDLLDAAGDVAITLANVFHLKLDDAQLEHAEKRDSDRLDALLAYLRATDLLPQHGITHADPAGARRQLFDALILDPAFAAPASLLAADLAASPVPGTALDDLIVAMQAAGSPGVAVMAELARLLDGEGHAQQASLLATAILARQPDNIPVLGLAGQLAYRAGHFGRARHIVRKLLDLDPENPVPYVLQGNLLAATNRVPGAAIQWEIALALDPDQPKVLLRLGSYLATVGEHERAFDVLRRVDALGASTADSLYQLGVAAYRLGRLFEATIALTTALEINPDLPYLHIMVARCYGRTGRDDLVEKHDARALELLPSYWPSALSAGYIALNQGRVDEALRAYTLVASARPDLPEALYGLGIALIAKNMIDDGLATLIRARELAPKNVPILCALTLAYLRAGRLPDAKDAIYDAMLLEPESADVARCLAEVHQSAYR